MANPSPAVTVNGNQISTSGTSGFNATSGSTITIALVSTAGITNWQIYCTSTDDLSSAATVNSTMVMSGYSATFVVPTISAGRGSTLIFTSTINYGIYVNTPYQNQNVLTFGVFVLNTNGLRLFAVNEQFESNRTFGLAADWNKLSVGGISYPLIDPTIESSSTFFPSPTQITAQGIDGSTVKTELWGLRTTDGYSHALIGSFPIDGYAGAPYPWGTIEFDVIHMMSSITTSGGILPGAKFKSSWAWTVSSGGILTGMGAMSQPVQIGTSGGNPPSGWTSTIYVNPGGYIQVLATGDPTLTVDHSALVQVYYSQ